MKSDYEPIGGETGQRAIVDGVVTPVVDDAMTASIFGGKSQARLREMECQPAANNRVVQWSMRGEISARFTRRSPSWGGALHAPPKDPLAYLARHDVPEDVVARWLKHVDALKASVLRAGVSSPHRDHASQSERRSDKEPHS